MKKFITDFWGGLSPMWKIITIVIIALIVIGLLKKFGSQLSSFFQSRQVNYLPGETAANQGYTAGGGDPTKGKSFIETIAKNIYSDIYDTPVTGHNSTYYDDALALSDSDLLYLAQYYDKYLTKGTSLYTDMDGEWYNTWTDNVFSNSANNVKTRLLQLGVK